jgi:hypothetical protein
MDSIPEPNRSTKLTPAEWVSRQYSLALQAWQDYSQAKTEEHAWPRPDYNRIAMLCDRAVRLQRRADRAKAWHRRYLTGSLRPRADFDFLNNQPVVETCRIGITVYRLQGPRRYQLAQQAQALGADLRTETAGGRTVLEVTIYFKSRALSG